MTQPSSEMSRLVEFVVKNYEPCDEWFCTTCGGILHFQLRLQEAFPEKNELTALLLTLSDEEIEQFGKKRGMIKPILKLQSMEDQDALLAIWIRNSRRNPNLALCVLQWTSYGIGVTAESLRQLLVSAEEQLILSKADRDAIRKSITVDVSLPAGLQAAFRQDEEDDQRKQLEIMAGVRARSDYLDNLSRLPFQSRVYKILGDSTITWREWRNEWSSLDDDEIQTYDYVTTQSLIDYCESHQAYHWQAALKKLYDHRHQSRLSAMEKFRRLYNEMLPEKQLNILVQDFSVPVEHYPVELANRASPQWLRTLSVEHQSHFMEMLDRTRLRVWRKVRKNLFANPKSD